MPTVSCSALFAFLMRASMSPTGSVSIRSPTRLRHPGDDALVGQFAGTDAAQAEFPVPRGRPAAAIAAGVLPRLVLLRPRCLRDQTLLRQRFLPTLLRGTGVRARAGARGPLRPCPRCRDGDVETSNRFDVVVVNLGEDDLLPYP